MALPAENALLSRKRRKISGPGLIFGLLLLLTWPEGGLLPGVPGDADAAVRSRTRTHSRKASTTRPTIRRTRTSHSTIRRGTKRARVRGRHRRRRMVPMRGSRAALIMDARTGEILFEKNSDRPLPVASLTKLMTVMIFLEGDPDLSQSVTVARDDVLGSGKTQLRSGEELSVRELLYHSLMSSDNAATKALVRSSGVMTAEYLARMNRKASVLGLHSTHFVEFTGLDPANVSSAADVAQLLKYAARRPLIAEITSTPEYNYWSSRRYHHLVNTNRLARFGQMDVRSGKTGFIQSAGYCLATWIRTGGRDLIAVVLGAPSNPARFNEARRLVQQISVPRSGAAPARGAAISAVAGPAVTTAGN